jgi:hypothetical protein
MAHNVQATSLEAAATRRMAAAAVAHAPMVAWAGGPREAAAARLAAAARAPRSPQQVEHYPTAAHACCCF